MNWVRELRKKGEYLLKGLNKGNRDRDRSVTIWAVLLLYGAGLCTESVAAVAMRTDRHSFPIWRVVSVNQLEERIGTRPCSASEPSPWGLGKPRKDWLEDWSASGALKFATVFLAMSWFSAVTTEIRRDGVCLGGLHLLEMKIKDFSGVPFSQII